MNDHPLPPELRLPPVPLAPEAERRIRVVVRRETNDTLLAKHLALTLGAVRIEEGTVSAGWLMGDSIGHQGDNCPDAFMPAERMAQVTECADM